MDLDFSYLKFCLIPVLSFILALLILKCCCKHFLCNWHLRSSGEERQRSVYVIPIPINQDFNEAAEDEYAPPSYNSIELTPPYTEYKLNIPDEDPPAYSETHVNYTPDHTPSNEA